MGNYFLKEFRKIQKKTNKILDVRGSGIMIAVEFVKDQETMEEDPQLASLILDEVKNAGVLFAKAG
jgi:4-aminobutyrate aminotransferase-like enzyme